MTASTQPQHNLPRSKPEAQGIPSAAILAFVQAAEDKIDALHSLVLVRHGSVVAEGWWKPYRAELPHRLFSLSKSFTASAVGLAIAEGRLTLDDSVLSFFPEAAPEEISNNLSAMKVCHLLSMSTGHHVDTTRYLFSRRIPRTAKLPLQGPNPAIAAFLKRPVRHQPGTFFVYNSGASYILSAIVQKLTGETLLEYLHPRLFEPLGIQPASWESCPYGVNFGGWGLNITTQDIAKFGQLYLQQGMWNGKQILSREWVKEASSKQVSNGSDPNSDWNQGYGFQFWRCRHNIYRGDGAFGQFCIIMPDQDAVLAITSGVPDMQAVMNLVWDHLLPAMSNKLNLPKSPASKQLAEKLQGLLLQPVAGTPSSPIIRQVSGVKYILEKNKAGLKWMRLTFQDSSCQVEYQDRHGKHTAVCGFQDWQESTTSMFGEQRRTAGSFAWLDENTCSVVIYYHQTPFRDSLTYRFMDNQVIVDSRANVGFGPLETPQMVGHRDM
jgi:CubicO group peptidase (beta-lactamase class C family)